jgi:signal recognition particle subunit SRP54
MFANLQDRLDVAFKNLKGEAKITELNVAATIKEIRRALVDADVNYKTAKDFTEKVRLKALGENVITSVNPSQLMVKIVKDELTEFMGGAAQEINLKGQPAVVLIAGLQGSGKTTFSGKLALYIKTKLGRAPMLIACDVYRPAAIEQLRVLGKQINVEVYAEEENKNPVAIAQNGIQYAKSKGYNVVIVDTAGRLAVDEQMMSEISNVKNAIRPNETLFVVDAMTGQDAVNTAKAFNDKINFDGVVLTKLDGDTRGGAALSIKYTVDKPIKFASAGEKLETLDVFHPERMAQRILGMGDIVSFVEKAKSNSTKKKLKSWNPEFEKINLISTTLSSKLNKSKRWVTSKICWE